MEEEEEIDIIGNYDNFISKNDQDISKISSGQILSCDYTVHPNWLNENPDAGSYWTDSVPKNENLESNVEILHSEEVVIEEPEPVPHIADVEWSRELGSHDDLVFEDDIPASIEEIVSNQDGDEMSKASTSSSESDHFELETAAFETHPPPENIKFIGPTHSRSLLKVKMESPVNNHVSSSRSLLKNNLKTVERPISKFKQTLMVNPSLIKMVQKSQAARKKGNLDPPPITKKSKASRKSKVKFKETVKIRHRDLPGMKLELPLKNHKTPFKNDTRGKRRPRKYKKSRSFADENITISHEMESPTTKVPISTGVVVKLNKCESDSEIEVDIESDNPVELKQSVSKTESVTKILDNHSQINHTQQIISFTQSMRKEESIQVPLAQRYPNLNESLIAELENTKLPDKELRINPNEVSELEKFIHSDFFENRTTKTPEQYLRIRNHILNMWQTTKPNYVSKTAVRNGLKHGGDVNCISRIHRLLEQIGAINFGLGGKYFDYVRPLETFISMFMQVPRNRSNSNSSSIVQQYKERRPRVKPINFTSPTEDGDDGDLNYTIVHMDGVVRPAPSAMPKDNTKQRPARHIKSEFDLIKCLKFPDDRSQPFSISITISTLLCMRLHALSSNYEVMGFLGGYQCKSLGQRKINLTRYKPCRTSSQSGTACEMCPVSQVEQSASLSSEGYELLGWFHSHPLFPANPSRTDIRTQKEMQLQFSFDKNRPFVGLILSCLNMSLKCIYMMPTNSKESDFEDTNLPYEIDLTITEDCTSFKIDVKDVLLSIENEVNDKDVLYDKFKSSSEMILQQFGFKCETVFEGVL